jgi:hypothetical protein
VVIMEDCDHHGARVASGSHLWAALLVLHMRAMQPCSMLHAQHPHQPHLQPHCLAPASLNQPYPASSATGERMASLTTDTFMGIPPRIHLLTMAEDIEDQTAEPLLTIEAPKGRITRTAFTDFNQTLVTSHDGGWLRRWDTETGTLIQEEQVHDDAIQDMQLSPCGSYVITASLDKTARLVDVHTLQVRALRPLCCCLLRPLCSAVP